MKKENTYTTPFKSTKSTDLNCSGNNIAYKPHTPDKRTSSQDGGIGKLCAYLLP